MHAAFVFQAAERIFPCDGENRFLHAAQLGHAGFKHLGLPAVTLGVSHVHPHQHRAKQRGFLAARAAADFHHDVLLRIRVFRQEQQLNFALSHFEPGRDCIEFFLRHLHHVRVVKQRLRLLPRVLQLAIAANGLIQRLKLAVFAHQRPPLFLILHHGRIGKQHAQLLHARMHPIEFFQHIYLLRFLDFPFASRYSVGALSTLQLRADDAPIPAVIAQGKRFADKRPHKRAHRVLLQPADFKEQKAAFIQVFRRFAADTPVKIQPVSAAKQRQFRLLPDLRHQRLHLFIRYIRRVRYNHIIFSALQRRKTVTFYKFYVCAVVFGVFPRDFKRFIADIDRRPLAPPAPAEPN